MMMKSCKLKILKNSCFKNICFLDPPYDTDFSTYAQNEFGHEEQKRLCECLKRTPAKILLIIKNTDFIYELLKLPTPMWCNELLERISGFHFTGQPAYNLLY